MRILRILAIAGLMVLGGISAAKADYYVWRDAKSGMSLSYPDSWKIVNNEQPDDVLTIMAPSDRAMAACRVRVRDDLRYSIFPMRYNDEIQQIDFSEAFWKKYLGEYSNPQISTQANGTGLGLGYAGYAEAGYWDQVPGARMQKGALMFASLFNNHLYVLECSSHYKAFMDWKGDFLAIASSVDFRHIQTPLINGNYRNFLRDPRMRFINPDGKTLTFY